MESDTCPDDYFIQSTKKNCPDGYYYNNKPDAEFFYDTLSLGKDNYCYRATACNEAGGGYATCLFGSHQTDAHEYSGIICRNCEGGFLNEAFVEVSGYNVEDDGYDATQSISLTVHDGAHHTIVRKCDIQLYVYEVYVVSAEYTQERELSVNFYCELNSENNTCYREDDGISVDPTTLEGITSIRAESVKFERDSCKGENGENVPVWSSFPSFND